MGWRDSQFSFSFLLQSVLGDGLEGLFDVDGLLCRRLKVRDVAFGLAPGHGTFLRNLSPQMISILSPRFQISA